MLCPAFPFAFGLFKLPLGLRVDVDRGHADLDLELDTHQRGLERRGTPLHAFAPLELHHPGLRFVRREIDGDEYVYAEEIASGRLAGYTVFNRLVELDRRASRWLRAPHSKYRAQYQRRGIATKVYRWYLESGRCLISGARQSPGAHALWHALARDHERCYVQLRDRSVRHLGRQVDVRIREALCTRMVLLGEGWTLERLRECAGIRLDG